MIVADRKALQEILANVEHLKEKLSHLKGNVDAVNMTDNQTAVVRMSSMVGSALMIEEGLEPNSQMVCQDRNRLAIMRDILGAYALGIRNMVCLSGDHQTFGNHPEAKNVHDIDSMQLIALVKKIRNEDKFRDFMKKVMDMGLHEKCYLLAGVLLRPSV